MPVTVGVNQRSVVHKSGNGLVIAFPDVCKTPAPPSGLVPLPYPNIAKTAAAKQQAKKTAGAAIKTGGGIATSSGNAAGGSGGVISSKTQGKASFGNLSNRVKFEGKKVTHMSASVSHNGEKQQLRARLATLNARLQSMTSSDPSQWQALLQEYAVTASALYVTLNE